MTAQPIQIAIELVESGIRKTAQLKGYAFVEAGFLAGRIRATTGTLSRADQLVLSAFTFTGCPIAAREDVGADNPWKRTGGAYTGSRHLSSGKLEVQSRISAYKHAGGISMSLEVQSSGLLPDLVGVAHSFQEELREIRLGHIRGHFSIPFITATGEVVTWEAISEYHLAINGHTRPAWRNITIMAQPCDASFLQIEQIDLFGDSQRAADDLIDKNTVLGELNHMQSTRTVLNRS